MSQIILTNWTIWFASDSPAASTGYKQIQWTGGGGPETNTNTVNELYSELMHYFSIPGNNIADTTTPMNAVTPDTYQIGGFDAGDLEPWFIDPDSIQHLTEGSIQTVGWTRVTGSNTNAGIVKVPYTLGTQFVDSDIGRAVTNSTATGTVLWWDGTNSEVWIRPTDSSSTHDWAGPAGTITVTSGTGSVTQNGAAIIVGERLWSDLFTLGTIAANSRLYVTQSNTEIANFWGDGQIDRLYLVNDGFDTGLIDKGNFTTYARQYSKFYDNFITDISGGGSNPVPLGTATDTNNATGYRNVTVTGSSGVFTTGELVTGGTTTAIGVVTSNVGSPTTSFVYYLIDDLTDFNSSETLTGSIVGSNGSTSGATTATGPATYTDITYRFGQLDETFHTNTGVDGGTEVITTTGTHPWATEDIVEYSKEGGTDAMGLAIDTLYYVNDISGTTLSLHTSAADAQSDTARVNLTASGGSETHLLARIYDLDEDDVGESFSIIVECAGRPITELYEKFKYDTRRGETTTLNGIEGQQYIGTNFRVDYDSLTGTIATGAVLTQLLADGTTTTTTVQKHHTIDGFLMLRDTDGIFEIGGGAANLQIDGSNYVVMTGAATTEAISPVKVSPFGQFAGGKFFGARGVYPENFDALDTNSIELTTDGNVVQTPPLTVTFQLTGLETNTEVRLCDSDLPDGSSGQELAGTESSSTSFSYQYIYAGDVNAHVIIHHIDFVWQRINGITLSTSDQTIPVQQRPDRNYSNP